jgi:hypothetical protein
MEFPQAGADSPIFGRRFPYPFDGKTMLLDVARRFAGEFNLLAKAQLRQLYGVERAEMWQELAVTSAYPTVKQHCPRIAILRLGSSPKPSGIGLDWHEAQVQLGGGQTVVRRMAGQVITDQLEAAICTLNEQMRDDLYLWFQQYLIDATLWMLPQLRDVGFYDLSCTNAVDDQVEYQGTQAQPGFEFYVARITCQATYDFSVLYDVDVIKNIFNWESLTPGGWFAGVAGPDLGQSAIPDPPDRNFAEPTE